IGRYPHLLDGPLPAFARTSFAGHDREGHSHGQRDESGPFPSPKSSFAKAQEDFDPPSRLRRGFGGQARGGSKARSIRQAERQILARITRIADGDDDVLLA